MINIIRRILEHFIIQLLLLVVVLNLKSDKSLSTAFSPTTPTTIETETIRRELSCKQRIRASFSALSLLSSTTEDYPIDVLAPQSAPSTASDDRRNQSLEQGNHPLWSLNLNLDSLAQAGAGSRAQELLKRIHALYTEGYYDVSPDIVSYNSVLKAWKEDEQPEAALELLETMIRNERECEDETENALYDPSDKNRSTEKTIRVDIISFNTVIAAFANQGNYHKSLEILRKMQKNPKESDSDGDEFDGYFYPDPDSITYNIVLYGLAQSDDLGAAAEAENLLREMMLRKERTGMSVVDTMSFNTVLYAWSREGEKNPNESSIEIATGGTTVNRKKKKKPVSSEMAAQRAIDLLTIMEELSEAGNLNVRPDVYSYTTAIQCWAKCRDPKRVFSMTTSTEKTFTDKAQDVLNRMIERGLQPNKLTYTALMNALSKAGKPERAEYVLHQMIQAQHQPDTVAFSSIIDGYARISSKDRPEAASRALQILETMKGNAPRGMGPSATTYTSVLTALAKSGLREACDQAFDLLQNMEEDYSAISCADESSSRESFGPESRDQKRNKWSLRPTNIHYNCVLNAYARSSRADKAIKAQNLMTVMENHSRLDCRPDTISYNSLMMACGHATGGREMKEQSFEIALRTLKILLSKGGNGKQMQGLLKHKPVNELYATSSTFANFFRACRKLLQPSNARRGSIMTKSLTICRKLGMLNSLVVHQIQLSCQSETAWKEMAGELSEYVGWKENFQRCDKNVPREWTCNARK